MTAHPNDARLRSFVDVPADSHFPIQNLPYGVFSTEEQPARVGVAIGDYILDLAALEAADLLRAAPAPVFGRPNLQALFTIGPAGWTAVRSRISELLRADNVELAGNAALRAQALVPMQRATMHLPFEVSGYTDFYSSKEHATNVGKMFRDPQNALLPNWLEMPIAYNGRASSVVVSGTPVRRPSGQMKATQEKRPSFGACRKLDFELETAFIVGIGNALGEPVRVDQAGRHLFGMMLLNDWSARDLQQWEYVPLGPFNSKSFMTSISPWVVTFDALEPFRVAGPAQDPQPLPYLQQAGKHGYDIDLQVVLRAGGATRETTLTRSNFKFLYWSMAQQLAHHTVSGCNTRAGDLMGSGTISGPTLDSCGSLLELTSNGQNPLTLDDGARRSFLEDGDELSISGWSSAAGYRVGFGEVTGRIEPA